MTPASKSVAAIAAACLVSLAGCATPTAPEPAGPPALAAFTPRPPVQSCEALARTAFADASVRITAADARAAGPVTGEPGPAQSAPAHCEVSGRLQERQGANGQTYAIKLHMRLPVDWNGRFFFQGGGGSNGVVGPALGTLMASQPGNALSLGYAVISQDSGHDNAVNNDPRRQGVVTFGWDPEARRNYGGASIGPVTQVGRELIRAYYGRDPQLTYYVGGSKGGQEALMAAQRFPQLFDAVLAGYPGFRLADAGAVGQMWDAQVFAEASRAMGQTTFEGTPLLNRALSDDDLVLVSDAILFACDELDGTRDGMVENFPACSEDKVAPRLQAVTCKDEKLSDCLAPAQVTALRKSFGGAKGRQDRQIYADWPWDAGVGVRTKDGVTQGWRAWKIGPYASAVNSGRAITLGGPSASAVFTSPPVQVAADPAALTRYALGLNVELNWYKAREKWGPFNESSVDFMHADAVDLTAFTRRGGKILMYHGVSDPVFSINDTISWLKAVDAHAQGGSAEFVRLFAVPGMNHGGGGPATDQFDAFGALVAWRERGVAPEALVATARATSPWPGRTRLLCPWPKQPRRTGADIERAESFACVLPEAPLAAAGG